MRPLHHAALVTVGTQETERNRLVNALRLDREWVYETESQAAAQEQAESRRVVRAINLGYRHWNRP